MAGAQFRSHKGRMRCGCSIVIPVHNGAKYIAQAVESALCQTYTDTEIIIIDDGSTDSTPSILKSYEDRIKIVTQENQGPSAARNAGIAAARGDYVAFLDADDIWMPRRLERMVKYLEMNPRIGFATSDAYLIDEDIPSLRTYYDDCLPMGRFPDRDQGYWILIYNFIFVMTVVRRRLFLAHGGFDEDLRTCEDWELWARFITGGEDAGFVAKPLAHYRIRSDSLSRTQAFLDELGRLPDRMLRRRNVQYPPGIGKAYCLALGKEALNSGDLARARTFLAAASRDPALPRVTRFRARAASAAPRLARALSPKPSFSMSSDGTLLRDSRGRTYFNQPSAIQGYCESFKGKTTLAGWAISTLSGDPVDWVLVLVGNEFIASARPTQPRLDVAAHLTREEPINCGFRISLQRQPPEGDVTPRVFCLTGDRFSELPFHPAAGL